MSTAEANTDTVKDEVMDQLTDARKGGRSDDRVGSGDFVLFHEILENCRETVSILNGKPVTIWYDPSAFTPELETEINKLETGKGKSMSESILKMLDNLFLDWSVFLPNPKDPNGTDKEKADFVKYPPIPFPPTRMNLMKVPFDTLVLLIRDIVVDLRPKKKNE